MKLRYSESADAIYVSFGTRKRPHQSEEMHTAKNLRVVDHAKDGTIVGVEILDTHEGVDVEGLPRADEIATLLEQIGFRVTARSGAA